MRAWKQIRVPDRPSGFTSIELPASAVKEELEALPARAPLPDLPAAIQSLRQRLTRGPVLAEADAAGLVVRKDQGALSQAETDAYKAAVMELVSDGTYQQLVVIHADMRHNMHGTMGPTGMLRFLPWHRRYVVEFERALAAADRKLRPNGNPTLSVPYWNWADPFPDWLQGFLPSQRPDAGTNPPDRKEAAPPQKPAAADIAYLLTGYAHQLPNVNVNDYVRFTYGLEGWGKRADGAPLPAHNQVHDWVGGIMSDIQYSPTDPIFWLHHAEVDRLWALWQKDHPAVDDPLTGADRVMDPWSESYDAVRATEALRYIYA